MKSPGKKQMPRLEALPNVGKSIARDLRAIGITTPAQLRRRAPLSVFHELKTTMGRRHDPCVLYTLLSVRHFFETSESLPWWRFTAQGKAELLKPPSVRKHKNSTAGGTPPVKLDLQTDQKRLRAYVEKRIRDYAGHRNQGPGDAGDAIRLVTFGFYAEQGGYVNLVFDPRPDARMDGEWTLYLHTKRNTFAFPQWYSAYESICDGQVVPLIRHDGTPGELQDSDGDEGVNRVFGEMIVDLMLSLREEGTLRKLPLAPAARMTQEEFDGRYAWPVPGTKETESLIAP
jgi:DNA transformation protein